MYDFSGSGSDVGSWRDMSDGCADDPNSKANDACKNQASPWYRTFFNKKLTRFQNSVVSYDKYIIVYGFNMNNAGLYQGPTTGIMYLNVETEQWYYPWNHPSSWTRYKEKSKYFIFLPMQ